MSSFSPLKLTYTDDTPLTDSERQARVELAAAYQICALLHMDDLTYTHLSARAPDGNSFYIYPFGLLFEEVTASNLLRVSLEGEVLEGSEYQYNRTGYIIHGHIYAARPDIQAIFHFHTPANVAVSAHPQGLLPLSQWALHFYNRIAYHDYNSLALETTQGQKILADLANYKVLLMRHHGALTCGATIQEAFFYAWHLEQACKTQCLMLSQNTTIIPLSVETCEKAVTDLLSFEKNIGERDWQAMLRKLNRLNICYDDLSL
jgi:ribulose-5-phosphate 4-epimerase/fuculose-1-phosphate aldolase